MAVSFTENPLRESLVHELHARPFETMNAPEQASHIAVLTGEQGGDADARHLGELCQRYGAPPPPEGAQHHIVDLGAFRVRWERHTEFCTYTFYREEPFDAPFDTPVIDLVPKDWLEGLPGEVFGAIHLTLETKDTPNRQPHELARLFGGNSLVGCRVAGGRALLFSDLRLHEDRFARILVRDMGLNERQAGRLAQRAFELNTYRLLALLALPVARKNTQRINQLENDLAEITRTMAEGNGENSEAHLLGELSRLSAETETIIAASGYRYRAAKAYGELVKKRLEDLRQERIEGLQTFTEFLDRRFTPALATIEAADRRQEELSKRASRVTALLRTRVEVELAEQNKDLLESMDRRSHIALRLQETVEGLSVVAISYYLVGLVRYAFKGLKETGALPLDLDIATGLSVPLVVLLVWFSLKRVKRSLHKEVG